ncbi:MAG TPA: BON domain-containing protein [Phenylobacterium sp.]
MRRQDIFNRNRGRERSWDVRDLREDYGQADYSRDYAFDRHRRTGYRTEPAATTSNDFGQADFSRDYEYDPRSRTAVRREPGREPLIDAHPEDRGYRPNERALDRDRSYEDRPVERRLDDPRTWFGGGPRTDRDPRDVRDVQDPRVAGDYREDRTARGYDPDERLWRAVTDRLVADRRIDPRDVEVEVHKGEVTLRGMVDTRDEKRRAEDLADIDGVIDVHNQLRIRDRYAGESRGSSWRRGFGLSD